MARSRSEAWAHVVDPTAPSGLQFINWGCWKSQDGSAIAQSSRDIDAKIS